MHADVAPGVAIENRLRRCEISVRTLGTYVNGLSSSFGGDFHASSMTNRLLSARFCDDFRLAEVAQHLLTREHEATRADAAGVPARSARLETSASKGRREADRPLRGLGASRARVRPRLTAPYGRVPASIVQISGAASMPLDPRPGGDHAALTPPQELPDSPPKRAGVPVNGFSGKRSARAGASHAELICASASLG
jgi:hypothetical protein